MAKKPDGRGQHLSGFADRGVDGWEERVMNAVKDRQKRTKRWTDRSNGTLLTYDAEFKVLLHEVAQARNISMAGYCRRAVAAFIAHDMGVPISDVLKFAATPTAYLAGGNGRMARTQDNGEGFGQWEITGIDGELSDD